MREFINEEHDYVLSLSFRSRKLKHDEIIKISDTSLHKLKEIIMNESGIDIYEHNVGCGIEDTANWE
ncbi:MAG: hypothetical protein PHD70_14505 [Anaerostipes sp.]|nr:hypothetical protein [Anaerostipes sp.]